MSYVLLVLFTMVSAHGVSMSTATIEFPTMQSCENAAAAINHSSKNARLTLCMSRGIGV